jgi:hypothetical protein
MCDELDRYIRLLPQEPPPLYPEKVLIFLFCRVADKQCQLAARYFQLIGEYWWWGGAKQEKPTHTQHLLGLFVFFTRSSCVCVSTIQFLYLIGSSSSSGEKINQIVEPLFSSSSFRSFLNPALG